MRARVCLCANLVRLWRCVLPSSTIIKTCSAPAVPAKEPYDADSNEFNSAYSIQVTANSDPNEADHTAMDTFEHILQMTSHHEAVYAYYYMDDNNKVSTSHLWTNIAIIMNAEQKCGKFLISALTVLSCSNSRAVIRIWPLQFWLVGLFLLYDRSFIH